MKKKKRVKIREIHLVKADGEKKRKKEEEKIKRKVLAHSSTWNYHSNEAVGTRKRKECRGKAIQREAASTSGRSQRGHTLQVDRRRRAFVRQSGD